MGLLLFAATVLNEVHEMSVLLRVGVLQITVELLGTAMACKRQAENCLYGMPVMCWLR